jgi:uncharacterized membrane protein YkvA (DUF1232 family)
MWLRLLNLFKAIKANALVIFFAMRHPRTPVYIKRLMLAAGLYLISPIDIIPDYLPVVGMVDDAVILPTVLYVLTNMLPPSVKADCEAKAKRAGKSMPFLFGVLVFLAAAWLIFILWVLYRAFCA